MKRAFVTLVAFVLSCATASSVLAADTEFSAALAELSQQSGLPEAELHQLLSHCEANQQNIYFCAWRDQITAQKKFQKTLANKQAQRPDCTAALAAKAVVWERLRDKSCARAATKQWGEGSMKLTAQAVCISASTAQAAQRLERARGCTFR
jgi:hypothetical protein